MFRWAMIFFLVALAALVLGMGGVAWLASGIAKIILIGVVVLAVIGMLATGLKRS